MKHHCYTLIILSVLIVTVALVDSNSVISYNALVDFSFRLPLMYSAFPQFSVFFSVTFVGFF